LVGKLKDDDLLDIFKQVFESKKDDPLRFRQRLLNTFLEECLSKEEIKDLLISVRTKYSVLEESRREESDGEEKKRKVRTKNMTHERLTKSMNRVSKKSKVK
jgi:hypothetical protein